MTVALGDAALSARYINRILFLMNMVTFYPIPKGIYQFQVNSGNIRTWCEICVKWCEMTPEIEETWKRKFNS